MKCHNRFAKEVHHDSIRSVWAAKPPEIDGVADRDEWADAGMLELNHAGVYFKNDAENLYILFDVVGDTIEDEYPEDYLWIVVDVDRNKDPTPGTDVLFQILPGGRGFRKMYWPWPASLYDTVSAAAAGFGPSFNSPTPHRILEYALNLEEIGADPATWWGSDDRPPMVRMGLRIHSDRPPFTDQIPVSDFQRDMSFADLLEISLSTQPEFPAADIGPVFFGVGFIPYREINPKNGHATTVAWAPLVVDNWAFGGRLDVQGLDVSRWTAFQGVCFDQMPTFPFCKSKATAKHLCDLWRPGEELVSDFEVTVLLITSHSKSTGVFGMNSVDLRIDKPSKSVVI